MPKTQLLLSWFENNQRKLPWRETSDPYKIWLSEVILQQTRVDQGLSYYLKFVEKYPEVADLAKATEDQVMKLWQGLGYYSRARNLHATAKIVVARYNGVFPAQYDELIRLPGIGPYTAAAVASIAFCKPHPVMDGNVFRVVSRWYAIHQPIDTAAGKNAIQSVLNELIDKNRPGKFNQALMEFGATFCVPANPDCPQCIFKDWCMAFQSGKVGSFPVKSKKVSIRNRYFNYLVLLMGRKDEFFTVIQKRDGSDIWKGLYEFPGIEASEPDQINELFQSKEWERLTIGSQPAVLSVSDEFVHLLTHQRIHARFVVVQIENPHLQLPENYQRIPLKSLHEFPVSRLTEKFLQKGFGMK